MPRLKDARKAAGLTQFQLSERVGVSQPFICSLESGAVRPSEEMRHKITQVLGPVAWDEMKGPLSASETTEMFCAIELAARRVGYEKALRLFSVSEQDPDDLRKLTEFVLTIHGQEILLPPGVESKRTK
jgi:transcriptional regulator with XRE-family HTH domain